MNTIDLEHSNNESANTNGYLAESVDGELAQLHFSNSVPAVIVSIESEGSGSVEYHTQPLLYSEVNTTSLPTSDETEDIMPTGDEASQEEPNSASNVNNIIDPEHSNNGSATTNGCLAELADGELAQLRLSNSVPTLNVSVESEGSGLVEYHTQPFLYSEVNTTSIPTSDEMEDIQLNIRRPTIPKSNSSHTAELSISYKSVFVSALPTSLGHFASSTPISIQMSVRSNPLVFHNANDKDLAPMMIGQGRVYGRLAKMKSVRNRKQTNGLGTEESLPRNA